MEDKKKSQQSDDAQNEKLEKEAVEERRSEKDEEEKVDYRDKVKKMSDEELATLFETAKQADYYLDSLQRNRADYENYQKRIEREQSNIFKYANQTLLQKTLGVLDLLDRAIQSGADTADKNFFEGICLVQKEFQKLLKDFGVTKIEAVAKHFDPQYHEALQMQSHEDQPEMVVLQELETGYMYHDRVLRASKVIVNRRPVKKKEEDKASKEEKSQDEKKDDTP